MTETLQPIRITRKLQRKYTGKLRITINLWTRYFGILLKLEISANINSADCPPKAFKYFSLVKSGK